MKDERTTHRYACVTDYEAVYAETYFAHVKGAASFGDVSFLEELLRELRALSDMPSVLDVGGGNGALADALESEGVRCITIDAANREEDGYRQFDLSRFDEGELDSVGRLASNRFPAGHITTCFDVAEHIDSEHLPDFLMNLHELTTEYLFLSVSTRPSSMGNRYHSTVLPISTWRRLLEVAGFEVEIAEELQKSQSAPLWSEASELVWIVSHWQRINPFRESQAHQAYFKCRKQGRAADPEALQHNILSMIDVAYRRTKRRSAPELPKLVYHVAFWQDWSFLRSLMDVWPPERLHVILRRSFLAEPYYHLAINYLRRVNVAFNESYTVAEGCAALDDLTPEVSTLFWSIACVPYPVHLSAARVALEARHRGFATLGMQHGLNSPGESLPGTRDYLIWGNEFRDGLPLDAQSRSTAVVTGSPKLMDASFAQAEDVFAHRLGDWTRRFKKRVVVGLGLHYAALGQDSNSVRLWLERLCQRHPDTLFILRPHPEDVSIYGWDTRFENVLILDDIALTVIDWPVVRLLRSVDLLVTSPSTLVLDALAADTPVALYGLEKYRGPTDPTFRAIMDSCHRIEDDLLPEHFVGKGLPNCTSCLSVSERFFFALAERAQQPSEPAATTPPVSSLILNWSHYVMPSELTKHWEGISRALKAFVETEQDAASSFEQPPAGDQNAQSDAEALARENAELRSALIHAHRFPWKYIKTAWHEYRRRGR